jgi:glutaredoxin
MTTKRKIEIFSAGCPVCEETVEEIRKAACPSCEVTVLNMRETRVAELAKRLGIQSVPAVVIDGKLADCCSGRKVDIETLKAAGLGKPLT